ncbi:hypothetical protein N7504_002716 [Penicillium tannophilum]|nr:hypothetical protein N7504_002716 [Penicillium tannophilum]
MIAYARTGSAQPFGSDQSTNTALALSSIVMLRGAFISACSGSILPISAGVFFGALYLLSFERLRNGQSYGNELALLVSFAMALESIPQIKLLQVGGIPLSLGFGPFAIFGLVIFGGAFGVWLPVGLSLLFTIPSLYWDIFNVEGIQEPNSRHDTSVSNL